DTVLLTVHLGRLHPRIGPLRAVPSRPPAPALCGAEPAVPAGVPTDLLLLPQGVLPLVLALPARLRRPRRPREVHRRDPPAPDRPEPAPLLLLRRLADHARQHLRRDPGLPVPRRVRLRPGEPGTAGQRGTAVVLHVRVPLVPPRHGRKAAALLETS